MDRDLQDDMIKLVQYCIVTVMRGYSHILQPMREILVRDPIDEEGFVAWRVADYVERREWRKAEAILEKIFRENPDITLEEILDNREVRIFLPLETVPAYYHIIKDCPRSDRPWRPLRNRYLRVFYQVLDRWEKEPLHYEERQLHILNRIANELDRPNALPEHQAKSPAKKR